MINSKYYVIIYTLLLFGILFSACDDESTAPIDDDPKNDPELTSVDPESGKPGDLIKLYGKYFGQTRGTSYVKFNEVKAEASDYSLWCDTLIAMLVPDDALTGYIKVIVGGKETEGIYFNIGSSVGPPFISTIRPDKAYAGDTIEILGGNFLNTRADSYIVFHGSSLNIQNYISWTGSKIIIKVPENATAGVGTIKVVVNDKNSNEMNFTVKQEVHIDPPEIDHIEPAIAWIGDTIGIYGKHFSDIRQYHNGYAVIGGVQVKEPDGYWYWKDTLIFAIVPEGATTGKVYVSKDGLKSNEVDFTLGQDEPEPPVIDSFSTTNVLPNQFIDIYGKDFGASRGMSSVYFGGNKLSRVRIPDWSDVAITIQIPDDVTPGNYDIKVVVNDLESNIKSITVKETQHDFLIETVLINVGTFQMGTSEDDIWANPQHSVTLTRDFYIGKYEITQEEYQEIASSWPDNLPDDKGLNKPMNLVSWYMAVQWCNDASVRDGLDPCYTINGTDVSCDFSKKGYRLPTEAEWEYACRAGTTGDVSFSGNVGDYAWYASNSGKHLNEAGQKLPNPWGIYDMYGNVDEWVWDYLEEYEASPVTRPHRTCNF
jgi:formylglycine-generating enzyme required for sulfatase activity